MSGMFDLCVARTEYFPNTITWWLNRNWIGYHLLPCQLKGNDSSVRRMYFLESISKIKRLKNFHLFKPSLHDLLSDLFGNNP